ncbi:YqhR family membrane protein [Desulfoscipio geothermicus]|uniref:Conserved membrane protein YqhR n=1 Tax=Desulfoscipio geothermicus DSM 3669 TaxID=1121426 RepID=A0A1I6E7I6_9FIRM|nr:YqhR family membrane protein [Desulfoscipio geothermicus]SFR13695.1 Conserved membrane protein YqhR [Desulfoscipio geothermicus DSM 3669]
MNYLTTSLWFVAASTLQAATVWVALRYGLTVFNPGFTLSRLLVHLVFGQVAGYLLFNFFNGRARIPGISYGIIYGLFLWVIVALMIAPALNLITSPLKVGANATLTTLAAFLVYGIVAGYACEQAVKDSRAEETR